jgi:hypothetical protein
MIKDVADFLRYKLSEEDLSEIFYFIIKHKIFQYFHFRDSKIGEELYSKIEHFNRKAQILLIYIYSHNIEDRFSEWSNSIWEAINKLSTEEYLCFWLELGFISNKDKNKLGYDSKNKDYIFVKDFNTYANEADIIFLKGSIKDRLNELEKEGFKFED